MAASRSGDDRSRNHAGPVLRLLRDGEPSRGEPARCCPAGAPIPSEGDPVRHPERRLVDSRRKSERARPGLRGFVRQRPKRLWIVYWLAAGPRGRGLGGEFAARGRELRGRRAPNSRPKRVFARQCGSILCRSDPALQNRSRRPRLDRALCGGRPAATAGQHLRAPLSAIRSRRLGPDPKRADDDGRGALCGDIG
jgi:hypothetical protein